MLCEGMTGKKEIHFLMRSYNHYEEQHCTSILFLVLFNWIPIKIAKVSYLPQNNVDDTQKDFGCRNALQPGNSAFLGDGLRTENFSIKNGSSFTKLLVGIAS